MYKFVRKAIGSLAAILVSLVAAAQGVPDYEDIFQKTIDHESPYYYPALMLRYNSGDTTLTEKDYYYLYYGYALTDDYHPLAAIPAEDKVLMAFEKVHNDPSEENLSDMLLYAAQVMKSDPFSPANLNFMVYAYGALGDTINERISYDRLDKLVSIIAASGTGASEKSPIHILRFSHANDLLGTLGLTIKKRLVVSRTAEYITVADENGRQLPKGYYFDYSRIYKDMPAETPQPKRNWKINDYPIGGYNRK